jgi:hypothetical protein
MMHARTRASTIAVKMHDTNVARVVITTLGTLHNVVTR